jgi:hypothetical protein
MISSGMSRAYLLFHLGTADWVQLGLEVEEDIFSIKIFVVLIYKIICDHWIYN